MRPSFKFSSCWPAVAAALALALAGCGGDRSTLAPATEEAATIARTWWAFLAVCSVVYLVVMGVLVAAILKHRDATSRVTPPPLQNDADAEKRTRGIVKAAVGVTTLIVLGLFLAD